MFYLLENNRIIDSENYKDPYILSKDVIRNREVLFLTSFKDQVSVKGTIKKQSENVYNLIEVGDLVRYEDDFLGTTLLAEVYMNYGKLSLFDETDIKNLDILAIYKPNSKGDYIKVWEKHNG
jgi:hypothetical protein